MDRPYPLAFMLIKQLLALYVVKPSVPWNDQSLILVKAKGERRAVLESKRMLNLSLVISNLCVLVCVALATIVQKAYGGTVFSNRVAVLHLFALSLIAICLFLKSAWFTV